MEPSTQTKQAGEQEKIDAMDKRLEAIKEILVGSSIDRLDSKFKSLNRRVESSSTHLVTLVDELSKEMVELKQDTNRNRAAESKTRFEEDEEIRNAVYNLKADFNQKSEAQDTRLERIEEVQARLNKLESEADRILKETSAQLDKKVQNIESDFEQKLNKQFEKSNADYQALDQRHKKIQAELDEELKTFGDKVESSIAEQKQKLNEALDSNAVSEERLTTLHQNFQSELDQHKAEIKSQLEASTSKDTQKQLDQLENRLENWEESLVAHIADTERNINHRIDTLESENIDKSDILKRLEQLESGLTLQAKESAQRQVSFEDTITSVLENLATKVNDKFGRASEERSKLEQSLNQRVGKVEKESEDLKNFVHNDLLKYLESLNEQRSKLDEKLDNMHQQIGKQMHESSIRMETRLETMFEMNQKYMHQANEQKTSKKDDIREALKRLTDLLDE